NLCVLAVERCCVAHVEGFGLTCGYVDNSVGLSSVLAGKSRKRSTKLHPTSGALHAESPDALTGGLAQRIGSETAEYSPSQVRQKIHEKDWCHKIGAIVVAVLLSPYTVDGADAV